MAAADTAELFEARDVDLLTTVQNNEDRFMQSLWQWRQHPTNFQAC